MGTRSRTELTGATIKHAIEPSHDTDSEGIDPLPG